MNQSATRNWRSLATDLSVEIKPFLNGSHHDATSDSLFSATNPATGLIHFQYHISSADNVDSAVLAAKTAWEEKWRDINPSQRKHILLTLADAIISNSRDLALFDCLDMGKPIQAALQEIFPAAGFIRYYAESIDKISRGSVAPTSPDSMEIQTYRPHGVVAALTPWNFPLINTCLKIGPALAAGNTVVIKPSELTPRSTLLLASLAQESGVPDGVINVLPGDASTGEALVKHPLVDHITFTGSSTTGKTILRTIGDSTIKSLHLECGGKSPEIVFSDIQRHDLSEVSKSILRASLWNQGQVCVSRSRILIQQEVYQKLTAELVRQAQSFTPQDPLDEATTFGPLSSKRQLEQVATYIEAGCKSGAKLNLDGRNACTSEPGFFMGPTIFSDVDPDSSIAQEEIFGPVLSVLPFKDEQDAINIANNSRYGLAATLWTKNISRANKFASQLRAGKIHIIASTNQAEGAGFAHSAEPVGQSGFGVEGGTNGFLSYMRQQSITFSMD